MSQPGGRAAQVAPGITRIELTVGVNAIQSVNAYVIEDDDQVTVVDCGLWRPEPDHEGLALLERGLNEAGYIFADVNRIVVTHAHIDHYGLTGRLMELTGAQLWMHRWTDLDTEKYRDPEGAHVKKRDTYADHGVPASEVDAVAASLKEWMPYLYSVVDASTPLQGGETFEVGGRTMKVLHTPGHSPGHICLWSETDGVLFSGDHLLGGVTPPVTFERGFEKNPMDSYLKSLQLIAELRPQQVLPGHGRVFSEGARRVQSIVRNKLRQIDQVRDRIERRPCTVMEITEDLVARTIVPSQRNWAMAETLAHIAYLQYQGIVERRPRPDGVYEWYAVDRTAR